jgi:hypothetical protein
VPVRAEDVRITKITICGGGNGAQTLLPIAARNLSCAVDAYVPFCDEAQRLAAGIAAHGGLEAAGAIRARAKPRRVSARPRDVIPGSEMVLLVLPAFAHEVTLRQIVPFLDEDAWVGALPARGGFDYCGASILAEFDRPDIGLFGLQTLPWACRIAEYGRIVQVLGVKKTVDAASRPAACLDCIAPVLERMLGVPIGKAGNMLALTLANTGQIIHPGIMYDLFADWDGRLFDKGHVPLFYHGLSEQGAQRLAELSQEIQRICTCFANFSLDLSSVHDLKTWLVRSYRDAILDVSSLRSAFATNRAYAGLRAPVKEVAPGQFAPAFGARYLAEDVPYGLAVSQAIARLAGVETPMMDQVVDWARQRLEGEARGDGNNDRTPQAYDLNDLEALIRFTMEE